MSFADPLHVCVGLLPLAMYFLTLGAMNLASRPVVTTGGRDFAALGIALSGLVAAGPMELFLSENAAQFWGPAVWAIMLAAYGLSVMLVALIMRPRLIIYNFTAEQLRPLLENVVARLDAGARWAGDAIALPGLGIQLHLEAFHVMKNVQLVAVGPAQNHSAWRGLERALAVELRSARTTPSPVGFCLFFLGMATAAGVTWYVVHDPAAVTQALRHVLRR